MAEVEEIAAENALLRREVARLRGSLYRIAHGFEAKQEARLALGPRLACMADLDDAALARGDFPGVDGVKNG